ncbi:helix-turn-helix domain-containing protein [Aquimarina algiphila]|uniref:helix-turn-helix domain-containing protein n=1 Tax=Aquimarina algiphila TaxID=2047982 RepID=UPI00232E86AC|nr:AraC family transcriptional regulator [Aquimarina algiphila]
MQNIFSFLEINTPDLIILHYPEFEQVQSILNILYKKDITHIITLWYPEKKHIRQTELIKSYTRGIDCILETEKDIFLLQAKINGYLERITILEYHLQGQMAIKTNPEIDKDKNILFIDKVKRYLSDNHLKSDFNISKMAYDIGMSRTNFYSQIKTATNLSPSRMVMIYRLKLATVLLKENVKNISEIAFDTGFASTAYFTKCFRQVYQLSPSQYRKIKKQSFQSNKI